jgi:hypothetical protein
VDGCQHSSASRRSSSHLAVLMDVFTRHVLGSKSGRASTRGLPWRPRCGRCGGAAARKSTTATRGCRTPPGRKPTCRPRRGDQDGDRRQAGGGLLRREPDGTIREEEEGNDLSEYRDFDVAYGQMDRFLDEVYGRKGIHSTPGYLAPAELEQRWLRGQEPWPDHGRRAPPTASGVRPFRSSRLD